MLAAHRVCGGAGLGAGQGVLGESDTATTEIYTHVSGRRLQDVHERHHPRGAKKFATDK